MLKPCTDKLFWLKPTWDSSVSFPNSPRLNSQWELPTELSSRTSTHSLEFTWWLARVWSPLVIVPSQEYISCHPVSSLSRVSNMVSENDIITKIKQRSSVYLAKFMKVLIIIKMYSYEILFTIWIALYFIFIYCDILLKIIFMR